MRRLFLLAFVPLALAACGGTTSTSTTTPTPTPPATADHCAKGPADTSAFCVLRKQPPPPRNLAAPPKAAILRGLDAWGPLPLSVIDGNYQFGAAYLSYDPSKNWNPAAVRAYRAAGKGVVMVWETTATRAGQGFSAGQSDAREAGRQAAALGNTTGPIDFAIDYDAGCGAITPYFQGVNSIVGSRTNAYGGYYQIGCLARQGLIHGQSWQAYAWSGGLWQPASIAPLEQWLNGQVYDYDRALLPNYGQAFQAAPKPADPFQIMDRTRRHFIIKARSPVWGAPHTVVASEHGTMTTARNRGCHGAPRRKVCKSSKYHLQLLHGRLVTVAAHKHPHYANGRGARQTIMAKQLRRMS